MKIVFAGSPAYAVPALERLHSEFGVCAVITQPDKPAGRKKILTPTPVKVTAEKLGIPVYDFVKIRDNAAAVAKVGADIMITCAYGQLLTEEILRCFPQGVWNLHASLLPKFRGASPVQSAILAGERYTGVTVMRTELALDTGDVLLVKRCEIGNMSCGELSAVLSLLSAEAAAEAVNLIKDGKTQLLMQDESAATYCKKIQKSDAKLNFFDSCENILRVIKAMNPSPLAYAEFNGGILNVLDAEICDGDGEIGMVICADKRGFTVKCGQGALRITEIIPAGGKRMKASDFVNGRKIKVGDRFD